LHLRGEKGDITIHTDSLSLFPCISLDPNHGYPLTSFFFNSGALEANKALRFLGP